MTKTTLEPTLELEPATDYRDPFASEEYNSTNIRLPRILALRGENGADSCGYFISEAELAKANWLKPLTDADFTEYQYNSGEVETGLLFKKLRALVVERTPLLAIDKIASKELEQMVVADTYRKSDHSDRERYSALRIYELLLLDDDNQPLHDVPFAYKAKGANLGTFATHWQQLVQEVTSCHAIANRVPAKPKDARFNALCVFEFEVKRELVGSKQKSAACTVVSHTRPTIENWQKFFLGRSNDYERYLYALAPTNDLVLPPSNLPALAPSPEDIVF